MDGNLPTAVSHQPQPSQPNGEKVVFDDAGHMMALEIPDRVFAAMSSFLERRPEEAGTQQ